MKGFGFCRGDLTHTPLLKELRDRGLVVGERRGGYVYYCLATEGIRDALDVLQGLAGGEPAE